MSNLSAKRSLSGDQGADSSGSVGTSTLPEQAHGHEDIHQSKISPNDQRFGMTTPKTERLRKLPFIMIALAIAVILFISMVITILRNSNQAGATSATPNTENTPINAHSQSAYPRNIRVPDIIQNAPDHDDPVEPDTHRDSTYSRGNTQQQVAEVSELTSPRSTMGSIDAPMLGPKLPGDLGATMYENHKSNRFQWPYHQDQRHRQPHVASAQDKSRSDAIHSPIFFGAGSSTAETSAAPSQNALTSTTNAIGDLLRNQLAGTGGLGAASPLAAFDSHADHDPNLQDRKNEFIDGEGRMSDHAYLPDRMRGPKSLYEVKAGSVIPASLITGINSDLPGDVIGQVRENVYDTISGNYLLIPQGSRLIARYDSMIAYGQERVLVCWNRLIRPDGSSINLDCTSGVDLEGYAGFADRVDNHWGRIISGIVFSSVLSAAATKSQGSEYGEDIDVDQIIAGNVGSEIANAGQEITRKNLEIQPTIKIRPGFSVNVLVNRDMIIPPFRP